MIGLHDLITVGILRNGFKFLANNPRHIEFMLCGFESLSVVNDMVGPRYLAQAIKLIQEQAMHIDTYYTNDLARRNEIVVVSSGAETERFLGDYGYNQEIRPADPKTLFIFKASQIVDNLLLASKSYKMEDVLWYGAVLSPDDGKTTYICKGTIPTPEFSKIILDRPIEAGTDLSNWSISTIPSTRGYVVGASIDQVRIQCNLRTVGDISLHRIFAACLRGVIKSNRMAFENYGLQDIQISYTPPVLLGEGEDYLGAESSLVIEAKCPESWIESEYENPNGIGLSICAVPARKEFSPVVLLDKDDE